MTEIFYEFWFDAAHRFMHMPEGHKYRNLHGHSFRVEVAVRGATDPRTGFVVDFGDIEAACEALRAELDHTYLNDIVELENPSLENIARLVWNRLQPSFAGLSRITVRRDSCRQGCVYYGEGAAKS